MITKSVAAIGTINKAWAAAIAAPLADWLVGMVADTLWNGPRIAMPDSAQLALVSLLVGLVVYGVPNLAAGPALDPANDAGA
ncbi:hypothetical protein [Dongia mobilis]|jgi:hypothetical protein|uniref:hypothetical protein n=1 Tax=Dongia sp. TaxID=1977262 RepID=UPI0026EE209F